MQVEYFKLYLEYIDVLKIIHLLLKVLSIDIEDEADMIYHCHSLFL